MPPVLDTLRSESGRYVAVERHRVVVHVASHDRAQPPALLGHRLVSPPLDFHPDLTQLRPHSLKTQAETRLEIANYIESYYNDVRRHSYVNYVSPVEFELTMS